MVLAEGEFIDPTDWMEVTTPEVTLALLSEDVVELIEENSSEGFGYVELATAARDAAIAARNAALAEAWVAADEASTFAGVSASLGAGNLVSNDILGPASGDVGRWEASGAYALTAVTVTPPGAPV